MDQPLLDLHPVYSSWAYTKDEMDKCKINNETYKWLKETYKIATEWFIENKKLIIDDFDIVYESTGVGYGTHSYKIIKNSLDLPNNYLALICDDGNLCFGYSMRNGNICIHID